MPKTLEEWQRRLEQHFGQLDAARTSSAMPVFALEHGLSPDEIRELSDDLRARLAANAWVPPHWLVWVVYAAECGYEYEGDEFWQSFEENTPHWRGKGKPEQIRNWYWQFHEAYNGVEPSGQWAEWFRNIAWPITHAILPRYLQTQLAKALYDLRYQLSRLESMNAREIGRLLNHNVEYATSRFREFLQQEELVGRIVLALLGDSHADIDGPLYPPTLRRIVADLERVQTAREWLKETQRYVADRIKGVDSGETARSSSTREEADDSAGSAPEPVRLRPTLLLKRSSSEEEWTAVLEIPSLSGLAQTDPAIRQFLKTTRCQVAGTGGTWLPAGWVLSGPQRRVIRAWPTSATPLLRFEHGSSAVARALQSELFLPQSEILVFKINEDGLARQLVSRIVRPGEKYVLFGVHLLPLNPPLLSAATITCEGLTARTLAVPDPISNFTISQLEDLGLQVARTIHVWPAGLSAQKWDGEGECESLTTESLCLGITHDAPVAGYRLSLDDRLEMHHEAGETGAPIFIQLPILSEGSHTLKVMADFGHQTRPHTLVEGQITIMVREPRPWIPGTTSYTGLAVSINPPEPTLDEFLEGSIQLNVSGPSGYEIKCSLGIISPGDVAPTATSIGTFPLPLDQLAWRRKLNQFINNETLTWSFRNSRASAFIIEGEELGEFRLRLERHVKPLRWSTKSIHGMTHLRLLDDTGDESPLTWHFYDFSKPAVRHALANSNPFDDLELPAAGGLLTASKGEFNDCFVSSAAKLSGSLKGLLIEPQIPNMGTGLSDILDFLTTLQAWNDARAMGLLATLRRSRVLHRLVHRFVSHFCGAKWADAEDRFLSNRSSHEFLTQLVSAVGWNPAFSKALASSANQFSDDLEAGADWFVALTAQYRVCNDPQLSRLALQIASRPQHLLKIEPAKREQTVRKLKQLTSLLRAARLLTLLLSTPDQSLAEGALPRREFA